MSSIPAVTPVAAATEAAAAPIAAEKPVEAPAAVSASADVEKKESEKTEEKKEETVPEPTVEPAVASTEKVPEEPAPATTVPSTTQEDSTPAPVEPAPQQEQAAAPAVDSKVEKATAALASTSIAPTEGTTTPGDVTVTDSSSAAPTWPELGPDHPLTQFYDALPGITAEASHSEVYGIELSHSNTFHTKLILQKFLRANANDLTKAKQQLLDTLKWRKEFDPVSAATAEYEKERFDGLGYIVEVEGVPASDSARADGKDVVTFNVYGAVKDKKKTFGDVDGYVTCVIDGSHGCCSGEFPIQSVRQANICLTAFSDGVSASWSAQCRSSTSLRLQRPSRTMALAVTHTRATKSTTTSKSL